MPLHALADLSNATAASQAEMEAGTEAALRVMSPLRVSQAIAALGGGGGTWGSITGTLGDQTDLQAALDLKMASDPSLITDATATAITNQVAITKEEYATIPNPAGDYPTTLFNITNSEMGDYGAFVAGEFLVDTSATDATGLAAGDLRYNNATQGSATSIFVAGVSAGGVDLTALLKLLKVGNEILLQDADAVANFQVLTISAAPSVSGGNWTIPVTVSSSGGTGATGFANNLDIIVAVGPGQTIGTGTVIPWEITVACSDEATALTTGTAKVSFRMPWAATLTSVRANVGTAPTGSTLVVDINEGDTPTSVLSTKLSIDASEKTSTTAATPAVISDAALADDALITVDIDQIGSTIAGAGLKVTLKGTRTV